MQSILTSTVIATIISSLLAMTISDKKNKLKYITNERQRWRNQIREIGEKINNTDNKTEIINLLTPLKLRINSYGFEDKKNILHDGHIWEIIRKFESDTSYEVKTFKNRLIQYLSMLLKFDWERSKNETIGNIFVTLLISLNILNIIIQVGAYCLNICDMILMMELTIWPSLISLGLYLLPIAGHYIPAKHSGFLGYTFIAALGFCSCIIYLWIITPIIKVYEANGELIVISIMIMLIVAIVSLLAIYSKIRDICCYKHMVYRIDPTLFK